VNENGHPPIFYFFGIGQPSQGPFMDPVPKHQDNAPNNQADWGPWLQQAPNAALAALNHVDAEAPVVDLNEGIAEDGLNPNLEDEFPELLGEATVEVIIVDLNLQSAPEGALFLAFLSIRR
jgi:hypothetical protein